MKLLKYPLIPFTLFFSLGITGGYYIPWLYRIIPYLLFVSTVFVGLTFYYANKAFIQKPNFAVGIAIFAFFSGTAVQALHYGPNSNYHYSHFLDNTRDDAPALPVFSGVITERLKPNEYSEKYYLEAIGFFRQSASGKLLVTVPKDSLSKILHAGDKLIIADIPQPITPALNPYQFDYAAYMKKQDVFHQIRLKDNYILNGQEKNFNYYIEQLRNALINSFSIHNYDAKTMNLINALLFGQRQDMDKETNDSYTNAGVVHILAISGLHFTLLFIALNYILEPLKRVKHIGAIGHCIITLALMWLFACITGLSASVVRAVVMFSFVLAGQLLNRRANIYNSLAASMLCILLCKPSFLFDAGFQLSYLAVFAIVWLQPIYGRLIHSKYWLINFAKDTVVISLAAQIGVLPLSLYYFNQFPLLFLIANVVVIPLSNVVLGLGITVLVLNFVFPQGAIWLGYILQFTIQIMNGFIKWVASFESFVIKNIPFSLLLNLCMYALLAATVLFLYKQSFKRIVAVLSLLFVFQVSYMATAWQAKNGSELLVFHNRNATLMVEKQNNNITVLSADTLALENRIIKAYNKGNFNRNLQLRPLRNLVWHNNHKVLIIDSIGVYPENIKPDVVVLTQSPKVNLDRMLQQLHPKQVVADATNYKTYITLWAESCRKKNIPFHATAEKGYYILK
ncbi:DUF4131 domain-containing protein [Flavobacterium sp. Sd200]|uniref:ComEC/Rec2 family competence protein n=1 Tax=Flavobacterium sp. Sd200 TaxID=2692211 RepID=UPI00136F3CBC|nr:ComEC/Rec2 family competence protein [Flavobacterium sp. Sd200]MXN92227.1 DUF4131 domain-containing protein [Flavobacterium sp. Sd200]